MVDFLIAFYLISTASSFVLMCANVGRTVSKNSIIEVGDIVIPFALAACIAIIPILNTFVALRLLCEDILAPVMKIRIKGPKRGPESCF